MTKKAIKPAAKTAIKPMPKTAIKSATKTSTEVKSPTSTKTSTVANPKHNITVTGGAGKGANTTVNIVMAKKPTK